MAKDTWGEYVNEFQRTLMRKMAAAIPTRLKRSRKPKVEPVGSDGFMISAEGTTRSDMPATVTAYSYYVRGTVHVRGDINIVGRGEISLIREDLDFHDTLRRTADFWRDQLKSY